jgi:DNA polymerase
MTNAELESITVGERQDSSVLVLFFDFESYYSADYTLTKMSPAEYILDPRFEAICLGVANLVHTPMLIDGPEIPAFLAKLDAWRQQSGRPIAVVTHNAMFDVAVLTWRYGFQPDLIVDTIAMSRTMLGSVLKSHRLEEVAAYFQLPAKGTLVKDVKGMTRADIMANGLWAREVEYCCRDTWLCREIYGRLYKLMPPEELVLHDIITRCATEPVLRVDRTLLQAHLDDVLTQKALSLGVIEAMGFGKAHLMSNPKLADVLRLLGVEPPTKTSPQTGEKTYAFAKSDEAFTDLLEHQNPLVRSVVEARLEHKSNIEETRTRRFLAIADLEFPGRGSGLMPMPVTIGAAHTHRVGGTWDLNVQNLGRRSKLRDALYADDGYTLLVVDSKQIEARFVAWFCDQVDLVDQFRSGADVYAAFASDVFGFPVNRKVHEVEGFVGKTGVLQLGYASGWLKFQNTVRFKSRELPTPIELADDMAQAVVNKYRARYPKIRETWRGLDSVLASMASMKPGSVIEMKCVTFHKELMIGPTGLPIHFPNLRYEDGEDGAFGSWWFDDGKKRRRTYGASLLETISQHSCRCIVLGAAARLYTPMRELGARLVHSAHDELVFHVPVENVAAAEIWARTEMNRPPPWAPDLPLDCNVGIARSYGAAK